jgi:hypothetical protein
MSALDHTAHVDQSATWVTSQKNTKLLQDEDNHKYRIYRKILGEKLTSYRCVMKDSVKCRAVAYLDNNSERIIKLRFEHNHVPDLLIAKARSEEKKLISAAAAMGVTSTVEVMSRVKTNIERSDCPEATACIRKSRTLPKAIRREKSKILGHNGIKLKTPEDIKENFPDRFKKTSTGGQFLRFCDYTDDDQKDPMLVFISDHGAWVLSNSTEIYCDGTFETSCDNFV